VKVLLDEVIDTDWCQLDLVSPGGASPSVALA
jgi:hypothetical protein